MPKETTGLERYPVIEPHETDISASSALGFELLWVEQSFATAGDVSDVTHNVTSNVVNIKHDMMLVRPWDHFTATLTFQGGMSNPECPHTGCWLIMKASGANGKGTKQKAATFFGFVKEVTENGAIEDNGATDSFSVNLTAVSWLEMLSMNQVIVALTARGSAGTFFAASPDSFFNVNQNIESDWWDDFSDAVIGLINPKNPTSLGVGLSRMWKTLGAVRIPPQISSAFLQATGATTKDDKTGKDVSVKIALGGKLGEEIKVVYDDVTRKAYAPRMTIDPVVGWSIEGIKSIMPSGQSTVDLLLGTFQGDINLIELYPSLEPFVNSEGERFVYSEATDVETEEGIPAKLLIPEEVQFTAGDPSTDDAEFEASLGYYEPFNDQPASDLASFLNANPILVYRIKPFRTMSMTEYQNYPYSPVKFTSTGKDVVEFANINSSLFNSKTWNLKNNGKIIHGFDYTEDDVTGWTGTFTESDHINSVSIALPNQADSPTQWLYKSGLPIQFSDSIRTVGLRHISPRWPFWPPMDADTDSTAKEKEANLLSSLYTVALLASHFLVSGDRFLRGTTKLVNFSPELRPGMTFTADVSRFVLPKPGQEKSMLTAYVDTVSHQILVSDDVITGTTTIGYSRGLTNEATRDVQVVPPGTSVNFHEVEQSE